MFEYVKAVFAECALAVPAAFVSVTLMLCEPADRSVTA